MVKMKQLPKDPTTTRHFKRAEKRAKRLSSDPDKALGLVDRARKRAYRRKGALGKVWDDLMALFRLVQAWAAGGYKVVPIKTILLAIAAIIYFVTPFDAVLDFLPVIGFSDDVAVILCVLASIRDDVEDFKAWEKQAA